MKASKPADARDQRIEGRPADVVVIIEDDADIGAAMDGLLRSVGLETRLYASALELLAEPMPEGAGCLVVDVLMPGLSGLELQQKLLEIGCIIPIVFITGHGDVPMAVRAVKAGAVDMLVKPFRDQDLIDAVEAALARHRDREAAERRVADLRLRHASLTEREREVMDLVVRGLMNKQIADRLGLAEITVKVHRAAMLKKMRTRSVAELVRIAEALDRREP